MDINELNLNDCDWTISKPKMRDKYFHGINCTIGYGECDRGHETHPHRHPAEQVAWIMQGECDFYVDGVPHRMTAGCLIDIPPMAEHYIVALSDEPVINVDVFCPKRPEFIQSVPRKESEIK